MSGRLPPPAGPSAITTAVQYYILHAEDEVARGLGEFEQLLLFAVLRLGGRAYGVRISQEILLATGKEVSAGAVYTGLDRLQSHGYVSSYHVESTQSRRGRPRKYYRVEPEGAQVLASTYGNITRMAEGTLDHLQAFADIPEGVGVSPPRRRLRVPVYVEVRHVDESQGPRCGRFRSAQQYVPEGRRFDSPWLH